MLAVGPLGPQYSWNFAWHELGSHAHLEDFAKVMKSLFYKKYAKNLGVKKASQQEFDEFKSYLSHYKTGQEETMNFLSYYQEVMFMKLISAFYSKVKCSGCEVGE